MGLTPLIRSTPYRVEVVAERLSQQGVRLSGSASASAVKHYAPLMVGALGVGGFAAQPSASAQFPSGGSTSVELRAGETKMIYVDNAASPSQRVGCRGAAAASATSAVGIEPVVDDITVNNWRAAFTVTAGAPGTYSFTCTVHLGTPSVWAGLQPVAASAHRWP